MADLAVHNHGSIFLLQPTSVAGSEWIDQHIPEDAMTWGDSIVVEHRYIEDIVIGAQYDGLEIESQ
jgi:hypothetical protein